MIVREHDVAKIESVVVDQRDLEGDRWWILCRRGGSLRKHQIALGHEAAPREFIGLESVVPTVPATLRIEAVVDQR